VLGLCALVVVALGILFWHAATPVVEQRIKGELLTQLSRAVGRAVTADDAELSLYPLGIRLDRVQVAGENADPPLLAARKLVVRPKVFRLLRSRGRDLQIAKVEVVEPAVTLVRREDGTWSLPRPEKGPGSPEAKGGGKPGPGMAIDHVHISRGQLQVLDRARGRQDVVLSEVDLSARDVGPALPLTLKLRASQPLGEGQVRAKLSFSPFAPPVEGRFSWPSARGNVELHRVKLEPFGAFVPRLGRLGREATLDLKTKIGTRGDEYTVTGDVELIGVELKGHDSGTRFALKGAVDPRHLDRARFELSDFWIKGPGFEASGRVSVTGFTRARFALSGPLLDLGVLTAPRRSTGEGGGKGTKTKKKDGWAPLATRQVLERLQLSGSLRFEKLRFRKVDFGQVRASVDFTSATLRLRRGTASFYGGKLDAQGSWLDLGQADPPWKVLGRLDDVEVGLALQDLVNQQPVRGPLDALFTMQGRGFHWPTLRQRLRGGGTATMEKGQLASIRLEQKLSGFLRKPLTPASRVLAEGTPFEDGDATFRFQSGWVVVDEPVTMRTPFGPFYALGRLGLNGRLDFNGVVQVTPAFSARVLSKGLRPARPVEVPLRFRGTLHDPDVSTRPWAVAGNILAGGRKKAPSLQAPDAERAASQARRRVPRR